MKRGGVQGTERKVGTCRGTKYIADPQGYISGGCDLLEVICTRKLNKVVP